MWDGNKLSQCFRDIVLAFGGNVITIFVIAMLGITNRKKRENLEDELLRKSSFLCASNPWSKSLISGRGFPAEQCLSRRLGDVSFMAFQMF